MIFSLQFSIDRMLPVGCELTHRCYNELAQVHARMGYGKAWMIECQLIYGDYVDVDVAINVVS